MAAGPPGRPPRIHTADFMNRSTGTPPTARLPLSALMIYSIGVVTSTWFVSVQGLTMPIFNIELGIDVALLGMVLAGLRIFDAFTDPIFAQWSDNLRSRFGRRRPFIVVGGLLVGLMYAAFWMFPHDWPKEWLLIWYGVMSLTLSLCNDVFSTSYYALGMELSPTYEGRTRVMAIRSYFLRTAQLLNPWLYFIVQLAIFGGALNGVRWMGAILGGAMIAASLISGLLTKERFADVNITSAAPKLNLLHAVGETMKNRYFWIMAFAGIALQLSMALFDTIGLYINIYYVFDGDKMAGAKFGGYGNTIALVLGLASIQFIWWLSNRLGKHATVRLALGWMLIGSILKFWLFTPDSPYLQLVLPFFYSVGLTSVFLLLSSMMADVVDVDELNTGRRREAMFSAINNWITKLVLSGAVFFSGWLIKATGFVLEKGADQDAGVFLTMRFLYSFAAGFFILLALLALLKYDLTQKKCEEIKAELDRRRAAASD